MKLTLNVLTICLVGCIFASPGKAAETNVFAAGYPKAGAPGFILVKGTATKDPNFTFTGDVLVSCIPAGNAGGVELAHYSGPRKLDHQLSYTGDPGKGDPWHGS